MDYLPPPDPEIQPRPEGAVPAGYAPGYSGYPQNYPRYPYAENMQGDHGEDPDGPGLIEYWRILRRRRGTLLLVASLGVLVAILVTLPQTPVFRARTTLEIQNVNNDFLNSKQVTPISESGDGGGSTLTDVQTQMKILQGENLTDQVIDKYKAADKLGALKGEGKTAELRKMLNLPVSQPGDADYRMRQNALKSLTVRQLGQTRMIEVFYGSADAAFAADFLNNLTAAYIESNMDARWQMSQRTSEWLSRQLDDMRVKLERSEGSLEDYARKSGLLYTAPPGGSTTGGEKTNVSEEKLRQLQVELSKAQADRAAAESHYEIARSAAPNALADVLNDPNLRDLQAKLTDLRRQEADLIAIYTPKHEKVRRVQAQIAPLETAFNTGRAAILDRIRNDYDTALARERLLRTDYGGQAGVVSEQAGKSIEYNILKREVDSNQQLYQNMLQEVKQASVAAAIRASNIRVVDPAKVPRSPYSPDYLLNCGLGLLSGLFVGISFIVLRERADRTVQQPGDVQFWTNSPELGVIPSAAAETGRRIYYARRKSLPTGDGPGIAPGRAKSDAAIIVSLDIGTAKTANGTGTRLPGGPAVFGGVVELMSWNNQPSMVSEAFHAVLASIMFSGENGSRPRLLVLTSGSPREGKTTVVSNLAIAMAGARQKVLIIDADMRKPRMHELYDLPNERGLSSLLLEESLAAGPLNVEPCRALDGLVLQTSIPYLSVLPSGPPAHGSGNLLYSPVLAELFTRFKLEYDMILVDTPPMLTMSDARIAGRLADAVVFVVRVGQTTREAAIAAHQRFAEDRIRVLGTILNDWDPRKSPNGYYGYHQGSYYGGKKYSGYHGYYAKR